MENLAKSKDLAHLGIVAGMIDRLEIVSGIDSRIKQETRDRHISVGQGVKAMLLNGLGFSQRTLYLVSNFFENLPVAHLLGEEIESNHLNDSVLGRILDEIYAYGCTRLYAELVPQICEHLGLKPTTLCMDSTDFHVDGKYNSDAAPDELGEVIQLTRGYSRDHRPDLNQVVLNLIVENEAGIVLYMQAHSGNKSDKTIFRETIREVVSQLQNAYTGAEWLMDSAGYTKETIAEHSGGVIWISRVPETLAEAQKAIAETGKMKPLSPGYQYRMTRSEYGGVPQRWAVIYSQEAYEKELHTLKKNYLKDSEKALKAWEKLSNEQFSCEKDARKNLETFCKKNPVLKVNNPEIEVIPHYEGKGRPAKDAVPSHKTYVIKGCCSTDIADFRAQAQRKGKFIIATNNLNTTQTPDDQLLPKYKSLTKVEHGFRFLKDPQFIASSFFVKKPERVEVLLFIMTLCLTIYAAIEYHVRQELQNQNLTLPNQVNKQVKNPTARWIFTLMAGIHVLYLPGQSPIILNLSEITIKIIDLFGQDTRKYYFRL
jgi:transposase